MTIRAHNYVPEQAESPPEIDGAYERNLRNGLRDEICEAIDLIDDRLGELELNGHDNFLHSLAELRDYLRRDMED